MIQEAIAYIQSLAAPKPVSFKAVDGREYLVTKDDTSDKITELKPALPPALTVHTLEGFVEAFTQKFGLETEGLVAHIVNHKEVRLLGPKVDAWGQRPVLVTASLLEISGFQFGQFIDHERFLIELLSKFAAGGDRDYVAKIASNITTENVVTSDDDGISQGVGLRAGVSLKTAETLRNRVQLAPYRTFPEAQQPVTEFLFRVRQSKEGATPELALFEADGGAWRYQAIESIAKYLKNTGKFDNPIIA